MVIIKTRLNIKVKVAPKPYVPTKEERQSHKASVFAVSGVRSSARPRALTESTSNSWRTRNMFLRSSLILRLQTTLLEMRTRKLRWWLRQVQYTAQFLKLWQGERVVRTIMSWRVFRKHLYIFCLFRVEMRREANNSWCGKFWIIQC